MKILTSASKLVFIIMALGAVIGFFIGKLDVNNFMLLATAAFSFYFSNKGEVQTTGDAAYAGK